MKLLGTSHRVAPRTARLTCRPYPRAIWKGSSLEQEEELMETHHEHDCSGRHLLVLEDDDEASGDCIVSLGSVAPLLLKLIS